MRSVLALCLLSVAAFAAEPVTLNWLGGAAPGAPNGVSWGVPWPKGAVSRGTPMRLTAADGRRPEVETWPVAFWPDGSVKWSGHAITADAGLAGPFTLTPGNATEPSPTTGIRYAEDDDTFLIDTGAMRVAIGKRRSYAIR